MSAYFCNLVLAFLPFVASSADATAEVPIPREKPRMDGMAEVPMTAGERAAMLQGLDGGYDRAFRLPGDEVPDVVPVPRRRPRTLPQWIDLAFWERAVEGTLPPLLEVDMSLFEPEEAVPFPRNLDDSPSVELMLGEGIDNGEGVNPRRIMLDEAL